MASILWAVYLIAAVTIDCRHLKGHNSQNTTIDELTEDFDIEAVDHEIHLVGDMMLTEEQWSALRQRKGIKDTDDRWSEGPIQSDGNQYPTVGYVFQSHEPFICNSIDPKECNGPDKNFYQDYCRVLCNTGFRVFPASLKPKVENAIQHWKDHACIEFVDITSQLESSGQRQKPHLLFAGALDGCNSYVGMVDKTGYPGQTIHVADDCSHGTIVHEIGHALGFYHEHNRNDRDQYIELIRNNIPKQKNGDIDYSYQVATPAEDNHKVEYDYSSVMHYAANQASINEGVTMVTKDPVDLELLGNREGLSHRDIHLSNKMYKCSEKWAKACGLITPMTCGLEGFYGRDCKCICPPHKTGSQCQHEKPGSDNDYYYEKRNKALNEKITSPRTLTVKAPLRKDVKFVKSIVPPACKMARVTFTSSILYHDCSFEFLHVVTDLSKLEGETLCNTDLNNVNARFFESDNQIIITTIIEGEPHVNGKGNTLWEAEVTFHESGVTGCIDPSTTQIPTDADIGYDYDEDYYDEDYDDEDYYEYDINSDISKGHNWYSSIFQFYRKWTETWTKKHWVEGKLKITFPKTVSSWNLELTFNQDINDLIIWDMKKVITSERIVTLTPKTYNTEQVAGNILNPDFQFNYFGSETPKLISATLNGDELC